MRRLSSSTRAFRFVAPVLVLVASACGSGDSAPTTAAEATPDSVVMTSEPVDTTAVPEPSTIVVTTSILGAVVSDMVGEASDVVVLIPNGLDPHDWEPSAKDVEAINKADLVVANGLDLEEKLIDTLEAAEGAGVRVFHATDHIVALDGEDHDEAHGDEAHGDEAHGDEAHGDEAHGDEAHGDEAHGDEAHGDEAKTDDHGHDHAEGDPHFWTDPLAMAAVVAALGDELAAIGVDVSDRVDRVITDLNDVDGVITQLLSSLPDDRRLLVTGHDSLGYFAEHYGFTLIGSIIPSLSSAAEVTAKNLAELKEAIGKTGASVIFTELGTPTDVADALADETGTRVVELATHLVPDDNLYRSFLLNLASDIVAALSATS